MGGDKYFVAKLFATAILVLFLLVIGDTTPAASERMPHGGGEKMLAVPISVGIDGSVIGWSKMYDGRVLRVESVKGKFPSIRRSLIPFPSPPPPPVKYPSPHPTSASPNYKPPYYKPPYKAPPPRPSKQ